MDEAKLYEMLGRKQAALDLMNKAYDDLLRAVERVSQGEFAIAVDLAGQSWSLTPTAAAADVPAETPPAADAV